MLLLLLLLLKLQWVDRQEAGDGWMAGWMASMAAGVLQGPASL